MPRVKVTAEVTIQDRHGRPVERARVDGELSSGGRQPRPVRLTHVSGGLYRLKETPPFEVTGSYTFEVTRVAKGPRGKETVYELAGDPHLRAERELNWTTAEIARRTGAKNKAELMRAAAAKLELVDRKPGYKGATWDEIVAEMKTASAYQQKFGHNVQNYAGKILKEQSSGRYRLNDQDRKKIRSSLGMVKTTWR